MTTCWQRLPIELTFASLERTDAPTLLTARGVCHAWARIADAELRRRRGAVVACAPASAPLEIAAFVPSLALHFSTTSELPMAYAAAPFPSVCVGAAGFLFGAPRTPLEWQWHDDAIESGPVASLLLRVPGVAVEAVVADGYIPTPDDAAFLLFVHDMTRSDLMRFVARTSTPVAGGIASLPFVEVDGAAVRNTAIVFRGDIAATNVIVPMQASEDDIRVDLAAARDALAERTVQFVVISTCVARFHDDACPEGLITREFFPDAPVLGFYSGGEIATKTSLAGARLSNPGQVSFGYTAILTIFHTARSR